MATRPLSHQCPEVSCLELASRLAGLDSSQLVVSSRTALGRAAVQESVVDVAQNGSVRVRHVADQHRRVMEPRRELAQPMAKWVVS